jgi:hypothetical protein
MPPLTILPILQLIWTTQNVGFRAGVLLLPPLDFSSLAYSTTGKVELSACGRSAMMGSYISKIRIDQVCEGGQKGSVAEDLSKDSCYGFMPRRMSWHRAWRCGLGARRIAFFVPV